MPPIKRLVWTPAFKRAYKRRVIGKPSEAQFADKLKVFAADPFDPRTKTHKLSGRLKDLWAFSVTFDCRVIFKFLSAEEVLLVDIGSHDEVY